MFYNPITSASTSFRNVTCGQKSTKHNSTLNALRLKHIHSAQSRGSNPTTAVTLLHKFGSVLLSHQMQQHTSLSIRIPQFLTKVSARLEKRLSVLWRRLWRRRRTFSTDRFALINASAEGYITKKTQP
jgi:hypothetical protein